MFGERFPRRTTGCWKNASGQVSVWWNVYNLFIAFVEKWTTMQSHDNVLGNIREDLFLEERHPPDQEYVMYIEWPQKRLMIDKYVVNF